MSRYTRHFYQNFITAFFSVAVVIAGIVMVNFFDHLLEDIAGGLVDQRFIFPLLGSGFLRYVGVALATAACLGGAYTLVQMVQRNEITAWQASGEGYPEFLSKLFWLGLLLSAISAVFQFWLLPANERFYADQFLQARQSAESRLLTSNQFTTLSDMGTIYVQDFDPNSATFEQSFLVTDDNVRGNTRLTTASTGRLESTDQALIIHKENGQNVLIEDDKIIETLNFESLDFTYPRKQDSLSTRASIEQADTISLVNTLNEPASAKELGSRISQVFFVFANTLLAGLLFFHRPRRSQIKMILAVIGLHLLYRYVIELSLSSSIAVLGLPPIIILQLPHVVFITLILLFWQYRSVRW